MFPIGRLENRSKLAAAFHFLVLIMTGGRADWLPVVWGERRADIKFRSGCTLGSKSDPGGCQVKGSLLVGSVGQPWIDWKPRSRMTRYDLSNEG